jgi:predicted tellurium resistance membrane protein TerC
MNITQQLQALFTLHGLASLFILAVLELVLGIDNIIFISLVIAKLPEQKRLSARITGLSLALVMRIVMLFALIWLSQITTVLFTIKGFTITIRDELFFVGGVYLVWNTARELKKHLNKKADVENAHKTFYKNAILQIVMVDILFSFDSIFTAIGIMQYFVIMAIAIVLGMIFMLYLSGKISAFINKYRSVKTIALCFIIAVGLILVSSAFHYELPKKYIYLAFLVAFAIEGINLLIRKPKERG